MTRAARLIATAVLSFLLISGVIHRLAVSLGYGRLPGALLGVVWLTPVAIVTLLVARSRAALTVLARIAESRAQLAVSILAVLAFLFTLVPGRTGGRWMVTYLAMAGTALKRPSPSQTTLRRDYEAG